MQQRGGAASHKFLRAALMIQFDVVHCILPFKSKMIWWHTEGGRRAAAESCNWQQALVSVGAHV